MEKEPTQEYIQVKIDTPRPYRWSTGKYLGKLYKEARDRKKLVTNRCTKCKELVYPPQMVCGRCKVEAGQDWVEMSDKGTVVQYTYLIFPRWDPHRGEYYSSPYPSATVLLDSGLYLRSRLEEQDTKKLKRGMRVQAVWKEKGRGREQDDIEYFRTIEELEVGK
jgi:uncharacterized OB-fold protein